ncbi:glucose 1-dehydrogenase [Marinilongibacter aquaticus]|uniref:SDR family NAD(P)-dependent oxidoreductase n=1 Tax=Marinilongibacter aquaticus TaxID=2975157 RepID=UPI0021BDE436|nr:glucose 1-dehydrogenase [Marinilongibacter aquaticus]UBM57739.1 glucose 1-dehydrogenase [Marinilongibacter aquaticus]
MSIFSLEGKLALVTGGGTGIGLAITRAFVAAGAEVVITGRREQVLAETAEDLGEKVHYRVNDVCEVESLPALVEDIEKNIGEIDILVNNAGINQKKPALEVTDEEFDRIIKTNLYGVFALTREVGKCMTARKRGSVIMISSMSAYYGIDRVVSYTASKTGVEGLTMAFSSEFGKDNVRVNAIAPGFIETAMMLKAMDSDPARKMKAFDKIHLQRWGQIDDVAHAAVFLASDASAYITSVSLPVDGGNSKGF